MNILILISSLHIGGAEKQAVNDANMLCANNNVYLLVFADGILKNKLASKVKYKVIEKQGYIKTSKIISDFVTTNTIDIIHASLFAPMIISALSAIKSRKPIIWNFHSHEYDIPLKSKLSFTLFSRMKMVKKITYVNNELREFFEKSLKQPSKKGMILYNSTEYKAISSSKIHPPKIINIGYVGRVIGLKRVEYLVDLAISLVDNKIDNFIINILGDGETKVSIEKEVLKNNLSDKFIFHGFQTELESYYNEFDIFVNPSREECLSIALIDAGIKGIPSVAFDVGGNNEIILNNTTGFIVKSKEEMISRTIALIKDISLRNEFGKQSLIHCKNNFSKEIRKSKLTEIFEYE